MTTTTTNPPNPRLAYRWRAAADVDLESRLLARGHTRRDVAAALGVSYEAVRLYLAGRRTLDGRMATRFARLAGMTRAAAFTPAGEEAGQ